MFDRYNTIDEADFARAVAKRFNGKQTANMTTPTAQPSPLSLESLPSDSASLADRIPSGKLVVIHSLRRAGSFAGLKRSDDAALTHPGSFDRVPSAHRAHPPL